MFTINRQFRQIERDAEMYSISLKWGTEGRITDVLGFEPVTSSDGRFIAFSRGGSNPVARDIRVLPEQQSMRYNGGGNTTDYLMSVLNYKQHAYAITRGATERIYS